jgi:hypothetical protein
VNSAGRSRILSATERVLVHHKRMILATTLAAAILAAIVSLLLPKTYTATARSLPPEEKSNGLAALLSGQLGGLAGLARASLGLPTNADFMVGWSNGRLCRNLNIDIRLVVWRRSRKVAPFSRRQ